MLMSPILTPSLSQPPPVRALDKEVLTFLILSTEARLVHFLSRPAPAEVNPGQRITPVLPPMSAVDIVRALHGAGARLLLRTIQGSLANSSLGCTTRWEAHADKLTKLRQHTRTILSRLHQDACWPRPQHCGVYCQANGADSPAAPSQKLSHEAHEPQ